MDLRNPKRKLSIFEDISCKKVSFPLSRDQSHVGTSEEDSFHSCTSTNQSISSNVFEPKAFLEGTESFDHITILVDPNNPGIMPQEVTVYGYENALFMPNNRKKANKVMFSPNLTHSMSNLYISPQKLVSASNSKQPFTEPISTQDINSASGCFLLNDDDDQHRLMTSWENDFINGRNHKHESERNLIPPCTQTIGHKIDPISKYVLTPNSDVGYLSNIQFNCASFLPGRQTQKPNFHTTNTKQTEFIPSVKNCLSDDQDVIKPIENSFKCTLCHKTYTRLIHYLAHLRSHINLDTLVCEICEELLSSESEIPNHISTHSGTDVFLCMFCSIVFHNYSNLMVHLSLRKDGIIYSCPNCPMEFCSKLGIINHKRIHIDNQFECTTCSLKFLRAFDLKCHRINFHSNSKKEFSKLCVPRKQIQTMYRLSKLNVVDPSKPITESSKNIKDSTPILCPNCSKKFLKVRYLNSHIRNNICQKNNQVSKNPELHKHTPPVCPYCSRVFLKEVYKKQHLRNRICQQDISTDSLSSSEVNSTQVFPICPQCSKVFKGKKTLRQHLRKRSCIQVPKISTEKKCLCPRCYMEFDNLKKHVCNKIENESPLTTNKHTSSLIKSSRHSGYHKSSYGFPKCKKLFSKRIYRRYHRVNCFQSNRKKVMKGKSLKNISPNLKSHRVVYINAMDKSGAGYICEHCRSSFYRFSNLQKHVRNRVCTIDPSIANNSLLNYRSLIARKRAFSCSKCKLILGSRDILRMHKRSGKCETFINQTFGEDSEDLSSNTNEKLSDSMETPLQSSHTRNHSLSTSKKREKQKLRRLNPEKQTFSRNNNKQLSCLYCFATFETRENFRCHIKLANCVKGISRLIIKCSACKRSYSCASHVRRHVKSSCPFFEN